MKMKEFDGKPLLVTGYNHMFPFLMILYGGRNYGCHTKTIDGEVHFAFKRRWLKAKDYVDDEYTHETNATDENRLVKKK